MLHVYLIRSLVFPDKVYIGITQNLEDRLERHNYGGSKHTSKYKPWKLVLSISFEDEWKATEFERYLKSGSGRSFAKRHFW